MTQSTLIFAPAASMRKSIASHNRVAVKFRIGQHGVEMRDIVFARLGGVGLILLGRSLQSLGRGDDRSLIRHAGDNEVIGLARRASPKRPNPAGGSPW